LKRKRGGNISHHPIIGLLFSDLAQDEIKMARGTGQKSRRRTKVTFGDDLVCRI